MSIYNFKKYAINNKENIQTAKLRLHGDSSQFCGGYTMFLWRFHLQTDKLNILYILCTCSNIIIIRYIYFQSLNLLTKEYV